MRTRHRFFEDKRRVCGDPFATWPRDQSICAINDYVIDVALLDREIAIRERPELLSVFAH